MASSLIQQITYALQQTRNTLQRGKAVYVLYISLNIAKSSKETHTKKLSRAGCEAEVARRA